MTRGWVLACVACVPLGCSKPTVDGGGVVQAPPSSTVSAATASPAVAPTSSSITATAPSASTTAAAGGSCEAIAARFDALRKAAGGSCRTDADCACFGDLRVDNQTGVSDRATAKQLQAWSDQYRARACPTICVQTVLQPKCVGHCTSGACQ